MIQDIRWLIKKDGTKVLQACDGHCWYDIEECVEE